MKSLMTPPAIAADAEMDACVPDDFPVPDELLDLIDEDELLPENGLDHSILNERFHSAYVGRYLACRELAVRLSDHILHSGQASAEPRVQHHILERYRTSLSRSEWTAPEEAYWVMHRVALLLGWHNPSMPVRRVAH